MFPNDPDLVSRPEVQGQLEKYHIFRACNKIYQNHPKDSDITDKEHLKNNLNWIRRANEDQYPSAGEKKYCKELQGHSLSFLELITIYQKADVLCSMEGCIVKWETMCFSTAETDVPMVAEAVDGIPMDQQQPAAAPDEVKEYTKVSDEEMWTDDPGHCWYTGHHKNREATTVDPPILTHDMKFIATGLSERCGRHRRCSVSTSPRAFEARSLRYQCAWQRQPSPTVSIVGCKAQA